MKKKIYIKKMNAEQSIKAKVESIAQIKIKNSVFYSVIAVFFIMFAGIGFLIFGKTYSMTTGNNGVIVQTYYSQEYFKNNNNMQMTIKNNNNDNITLKKIIYRNNDCIINNTTCPDYTEVNASNSFIGGQNTTIQSNTADYINLNNVSSFFANNKNVEVGIKYSIEGDDSEYVVTSNTMETESNNSMAINSKNNDFTEEEFVFTANNPDHWTASIYPKAKMYTKLSANNIHMNIDETLDSFNLKYQLKTEWPNAYFVASPFNADVQTANMLGKTNYSNFKDFFSFTTTNITKQSNKGFGYENMSFDIKGALKNNSTYTNTTIYPSFYWCLGSKTLTGWSNKRCSGDGYDEFVTEKIPQFKLTVYNKAPLANAINNAIQKQKDKSDSTVYDFNSYIKYNNHIKSAIELYNGRNNYKKCDENGKNCVDSDVNQQEVNYYVDLLNTYEIEKRPSADYSAYNTIITKIENLKSSWYKPETYNALMTLYNEKDNYLNYNDLYQYELNNYVNSLENALSNLELLDADITDLEAAIAEANAIKNKTYTVEEDSYTLYTEDSWNDMSVAKTKAETAKTYKIDQQEAVDAATQKLKEAIEGLSKTSAVTTKLEAAITEANAIENKTYTVGEDLYTLYTEDSWNKLTTALAKAETAKTYKIDQQEAVNTATNALKTAIEGLKKNPAVTTNLEAAIAEANAIKNKTYTVGEDSYKLYTEDSWNKLTTALAKAETAKTYKIDQQEAVDDATQKLREAKEGLSKTSAVTTNLEAAITEANAIENKTYTVGEESYTLYTEDSWNKLTTALAKAETAKTYKIDQQEAVDAATNALKTAIEGLKKNPAVTTNLEAAITEANAIKNKTYTVEEKKYTLYTEKTWNDMIVAKTKAEAVKNYKIDRQQAVDDATSALNNAIENLVKTRGVYTNVESIVKQYNKYKDAGYYLHDNIDLENYISAINYNLKIDEQAKINSIAEELEGKVSSLEYKFADYSNLDKIIDDYHNSEDYINNYYNEEDKKSLEEYINSIDRTIVIINQEKVTKIETDLKLKIASLKYLPADYTKINDLVSKINKLNKDNYSNFKDLQKLIDSIIYDKTIKEQNYVDKLYSQLYTSYKSLKTKDPDQESSNHSNSSIEQDSNKKLNYKDLIEYITVNDNKVDMTTDSFKHKVSKYTTEAIIKVGLKNKNYKVTIEGNKKLRSGSNIYKIIIKDNKNKKYTYSLEVIKEDASNYLSNIKISGYEIEFNKKTQSYKIKISEEVQKLNIEAIPEDKDAQVIIGGNDNLKNKSVVTIKVIATDKEERVYKIHIIKELVPAEEIKEEKDSKTIIPYVVVGIVATTIIGIGSYILFIKPKKF